jgi:hypothetical protein
MSSQSRPRERPASPFEIRPVRGSTLPFKTLLRQSQPSVLSSAKYAEVGLLSRKRAILGQVLRAGDNDDAEWGDVI